MQIGTENLWMKSGTTNLMDAQVFGQWGTLHRVQWLHHALWYPLWPDRKFLLAVVHNLRISVTVEDDNFNFYIDIGTRKRLRRGHSEISVCASSLHSWHW